MIMLNNICALCKNKGDILNSHIIPEFMYKPIYDDKHRLLLRKNGFIVKTKPLQKGIREKLLCKKCEGQLSVYEKYVREILFGGAVINIQKFSDRIILYGLDYAKVRLFFLSLIWRMSVDSKHEQKMKMGSSLPLTLINFEQGSKADLTPFSMTPFSRSMRVINIENLHILTQNPALQSP